MTNPSAQTMLLPVQILCAADADNGGLIKFPSGREIILGKADAVALRAASAPAAVRAETVKKVWARIEYTLSGYGVSRARGIAWNIAEQLKDEGLIAALATPEEASTPAPQVIGCLRAVCPQPEKCQDAWKCLMPVFIPEASTAAGEAWHVVAGYPGSGPWDRITVENDKDNVICVMNGQMPGAKENAERIVKSVNAAPPAAQTDGVNDIDPNDIWERYLAQLEGEPSPQGAIAFACEALAITRSPQETAL